MSEVVEFSDYFVVYAGNLTKSLSRNLYGIMVLRNKVRARGRLSGLELMIVLGLPQSIYLRACNKTLSRLTRLPGARCDAVNFGLADNAE